ncbi:hypothetical protein, conserved [Eimeria brunetti]|uniref:Uncharacterized protein n=1 Tax=Eimeria brunetti TaxID=51314 RepID=U6LTD9_9EIME|nr:hypothetical protein, conserved [Eimeria brunetti]
MEGPRTEGSSKSEAAAPEHKKGAASHEGAAGEQHLQQQKAESAAAAAPSAEPSGAPSAKASAAPSAAKPAEPSAAAAAAAAEGAIESTAAKVESLLKKPYEEGMGKMFSEGQHIVQMLQEGLRASRALKAAAKISARLRGEIVKDVEALKDTLHKEHQNLTLLRKYEQEQDALLKAQLGYLTPLNGETKAEATAQTTSTETAQVSAVRGAYSSQAKQTMGIPAAVSVVCVLLTFVL